MKIAIDAGHGYNTSGKRTCPFPDGRQMREHEFNRDVAMRLDYLCRQAGHETVWCSDQIGISDMNLYERPKIANRFGADIYISIHANALGDGMAWHPVSGLVAMTYPNSVLGRKLARCIIPELQKTTGLLVNSYQETPYVVLRDTNMPAIICECGFMTHKGDAEKLLTYEYRNQCAEGIFNGIQSYFAASTKPSLGAEIVELPKASLNTIKTNKSVSTLSKTYKNFFNGMFFSHSHNVLYDVCISNEKYLENLGATDPKTKAKGSFYIYTDGRCGVVNLRSIETRDIQMLIQGINLAVLTRKALDDQGWDLISLTESCQRGALGYDYKNDRVCYVTKNCSLPELQESCRDAGLVDRSEKVCAIGLDAGGSNAYVRDGKVIYDSDGRAMRNIVQW